MILYQNVWMGLDWRVALSSEISEVYLTLTNPNLPEREYPPITFKALTTLQFCYCVRPNIGIVRSGESVVITSQYCFYLIFSMMMEYTRTETERCSYFKVARESAERVISRAAAKRAPAFLFKSTPIAREWCPGSNYSRASVQNVVRTEQTFIFHSSLFSSTKSRM